MARTLPAYVTEDDLLGALPEQWRIEAADDDDDGDGETMTDICNAASDTVDAYLQGRYALPISDASALAKLQEAARVRALWLCYQRRGRHGDSNPWEGEWNRWAKKLAEIEAGKVELIISPPAALNSPAQVRTVSRATRTVRSTSTLNAV